jgi:hypothetical protein
MIGHQLPTESLRFRGSIIDGVAGDGSRFYYIDKDTSVGVCPCCGGPVSIRFAGMAARAELDCHLGCAEADIAEALGLGVAR